METHRDGDQSAREKGKQDHRHVQRHQGEEETSAVENKQVKGTKEWGWQQEQDARKGVREGVMQISGGSPLRAEGRVQRLKAAVFL